MTGWVHVLLSLSHGMQHGRPAWKSPLPEQHVCCAATCPNGAKSANGNCNCPSGSVGAADAGGNFFCVNGERLRLCLLF